LCHYYFPTRFWRFFRVRVFPVTRFVLTVWTRYSGRSTYPDGVTAMLDRQTCPLQDAGSVAIGVLAGIVRHSKQTTYKAEEEYNAAMVAACLKEGVEVVGITDHFRIATSQSLAKALIDAGIGC
jgi:hypothetical protein